jgi:hypothetical protein
MTIRVSFQTNFERKQQRQWRAARWHAFVIRKTGQAASK